MQASKNLQPDVALQSHLKPYDVTPKNFRKFYKVTHSMGAYMSAKKISFSAPQVFARNGCFESKAIIYLKSKKEQASDVLETPIPR
jgi:hypothetical protein